MERKRKMSYYHVEDTFPIIQYYGVMNLDLMQGGLYVGNTFKRLIDGAESIGKPFRRKFAADSFQGLPKETEGLYENPDWTEGAFNICADKGYESIPDAIKAVSDYVGSNNVTYIPGFFCDSLTKDVAELIGAKQISCLDVDVDIHSSSLELLDFAFKYKLLCNQCILRFDDYNSTPNNAGQRLAWKQIIHRFNVKNRELADNVFLVLSYD